MLSGETYFLDKLLLRSILPLSSLLRMHRNVQTKIVRRRADSKLVRAVDKRPRPCLVSNGKVAFRDLEAALQLFDQGR